MTAKVIRQRQHPRPSESNPADSVETTQANEKSEKNHPDVCSLRVEKKPGPFRADSAIHWDTVLTERL